MIKYPAYLTGFSSRSDGSAGIRFATQELSGEDFSELKQHHNAFGWLIFAENTTEADIPEESPEEEGITASTRLRRRMFVYWKHPKGKNGEGDFETWRKQTVETWGDKLLAKIE